jgi:hypothetical protein
LQAPKFNVEFLEEASEFLDGLDEKVRDKIALSAQEFLHHHGVQLVTTDRY